MAVERTLSIIKPDAVKKNAKEPTSARKQFISAQRGLLLSYLSPYRLERCVIHVHGLTVDLLLASDSKLVRSIHGWRHADLSTGLPRDFHRVTPKSSQRNAAEVEYRAIVGNEAVSVDRLRGSVARIAPTTMTRL